MLLKYRSSICRDHQEALQKVTGPMDPSGKSCLLPHLWTALCQGHLCRVSAGEGYSSTPGEGSPHMRNKTCTHPKHFSLAFLFYLNWQISPGKPKILETDVGVSDCFQTVSCSSAAAQARKPAIWYRVTALVASMLTSKTRILFFPRYTKWSCSAVFLCIPADNLLIRGTLPSFSLPSNNLYNSTFLNGKSALMQAGRVSSAISHT